MRRKPTTYSRANGDYIDEVLSDFANDGDVVVLVTRNDSTARGLLSSDDGDNYEIRSARSGAKLLAAHRDDVEAVIA